MMSAPAAREHHRDLHRLVGRDAVLAHPVVGRDAHRHRFVVGPDGAHRGQDLERIPHAIFERAPVLVAPLIRQRGDERGEQIAVRGVQLEHVEPGALRHLGRRHELSLSPRPCRRGPSPWASGCRGPRDRRRRHHRPVALATAAYRVPPSRAGSNPCVRSGRPDSRSWRRSLRARSRRAASRPPRAPARRSRCSRA